MLPVRSISVRIVKPANAHSQLSMLVLRVNLVMPGNDGILVHSMRHLDRYDLGARRIERIGNSANAGA
jgi:hypothetical protein